ncbi:hypothetical protein N752_28775 [Desulforamulus aquiferis]|nr:hypothetical protein [Desulforamulus aquiferis]RYD01572.1 hypothetical protein N752_28775 [Desulforamulus aquiferis]
MLSQTTKASSFEETYNLLRLWESDLGHCCPVIGHCLNLFEMAKANNPSSHSSWEQEKRKLQQENEELKTILDTVDEDLSEYEAKVKGLEDENLKLLFIIDQLQCKLREIKDQYYSQQYKADEFENCSKDCTNFELCSKRILIVGGITKLNQLIRI